VPVSNFGSSYLNGVPLVTVESAAHMVWLAQPPVRITAIPIGNDLAQDLALIGCGLLLLDLPQVEAGRPLVGGHCSGK